jgi:ribosomal protein S18 acetylase RimI-like enzyme
MEIHIQNSTLEHIDDILRLYSCARAYQYEKGAVPWPVISQEIIENEIFEGRQWKMTIDDVIACVWVTTFEDPHIWGVKDKDPSVYVHRIAIDPIFRGMNLVGRLMEWTKNHALKNEKEYIRLDTVGLNKPLIAHYQKNGFTYLGIINLETNSNLPSHYHNAEVCLFEMKLNRN